MSKIFYKFKSAKNYDTILFDGLSMTAFDLKREIMLAKKLGTGLGMDLLLFDASTNEEFGLDTDTIPRNTSVTVRRVQGTDFKNASRYLSGQSLVPRGVHLAPQSMHSMGAQSGAGTNAFQSSTAPLSSGDQKAAVVTTQTIEGQTEEDRIKAMFEKTDERWQQQSTALALSQQQKGFHFQANRPRPPPPASLASSIDSSANTASVSANGIAQPQSQQPAPVPTLQQHIAASNVRPPPGNYVCYRCGIPGHWIQFCPTSGNKMFDNIKIKKTTGIPKTFLQTVAKNVEQVNPTQMQGVSNLMVTPEGDLVVAQVNDAAFRLHQQMISKLYTFEDLCAKGEEFENEGIVPRGTFIKPELLCKICGLFCREAVSLNCCHSASNGNRFCDACIREYFQQQLSSNSNNITFCPLCNKNSNVDMIQVDKPARALVDHCLKRIAEEIQKQQQKDQMEQGNIVNANSSGISSSMTSGGGILNSFDLAKKFPIACIDLTEDRSSSYSVHNHPYPRGLEMIYDIGRQIYVPLKDSS